MQIGTHSLSIRARLRFGGAIMMRVLGLDPSLRNTGFAILESENGRVTALEFGVIRNTDRLLPSGCLVAIRERISDLLARHRPDCVATESVIYVQSYRTAITLGTARGAALLAAAERGIPIYEYAPRRVKQAVVGRGGAVKAQVGFMVRVLLKLTETPAPDAADALAIGLTHLQHASRATMGAVKLQQI
jgi:crossover junction endodeoxyribonuclease RuvC